MSDPVTDQSYRAQRRYIFAATLGVIIALIAAGVLLL
jgi:hypothetical protein